MKHVLLCLLLVLPAGCASSNGAGGPEAYCQHEAEQDPEVVRLTMDNMPPLADHTTLKPRIRLAQHQALQRCLLRKGVHVRGGVEPVVPQ